MSALSDRYGPWAVIAGASEGIGREFAIQLATEGINLILVSRRQGLIDELGDEVSRKFGVQCIAGAIDLADPDALEQLVAIVGQREVGLYISNAGGDANASKFLEKDIKSWDDLVQRNVIDVMHASHHFAEPMRQRGRGGILLVGSGACWGGGSFLAIYSATKAFELCLAEGLWGELHEQGVDVLYMALGMTDTPAFRARRTALGQPIPDGIADSAEVARLGLERLDKGPVLIWGQDDDESGPGMASAASRRDRVLGMDASNAAYFARN